MGSLVNNTKPTDWTKVRALIQLCGLLLQLVHEYWL